MGDVPDHHRRPLVWVVGATCVVAVLTAAGLNGVASESEAADCRADAKTLEVAIEAYHAIHGGTPASEADLVSGGLLRSGSDAFDVVDGAIVAEPTSGCAAPPEAVAVREAAAAPAPVSSASRTTTTTSLPADTCSAVEAALDIIAELDADDTAQLVDSLDAAASLMREARPRAELSLREDLANLAVVPEMLSDQATQLVDARRTADSVTGSAIDDVVAAIPGFLRYFYTKEVLTSSAPSITAECAIPWLARSAERDLQAFASALEVFLDSPLADDARFAPLVGIAEALLDTARIEQPMSALTAESDRCAADERAEEYGDNAGCDALQDACADRDLLACNDLFYSSPLMSAYEAFGATCGERVRFGDVGYSGYCEELDR